MNSRSHKNPNQGFLAFLAKQRPNLVKRDQSERYLRTWFYEQNFVEITTPTLLRYSSLEKNIYPLTLTAYDHNQKPYPGYLRVSPELSLKKVLTTGIPKIFELGPCFRNRENFSSPEHGVEFTLLEWYQFDCNLQEMMHSVQTLVKFLAYKIHGHTTLNYQGKTFDLGAPWNIISVSEAFNKYAGINFNQFQNWDELLTIANQKGFYTKDLDDAFYWIFLNQVEPHLRQGPTILYEYPIFQASFSKTVSRPQSINSVKTNLEYGLRFEVYLGGMEIANAFEELINPKEQKKRWINYLTEESLKVNHDQAEELDHDFLEALATLKAQTSKEQSIAGIALGWERLLMFLFDEKNISDVNPFKNILT